MQYPVDGIQRKGFSLIEYSFLGESLNDVMHEHAFGILLEDKAHGLSFGFVYDEFPALGLIPVGHGAALKVPFEPCFPFAPAYFLG